MTNSEANAPPSTHRDIIVIGSSSGGIVKFENEAEAAAHNAEIIRRMLLYGEHLHR
jgi:hypothetical protein